MCVAVGGSGLITVAKRWGGKDKKKKEEGADAKTQRLELRSETVPTEV